MPRVDAVVGCDVPRTPRVAQVEGMFDVPASTALERRWSIDAPIDDREWNVGLIVGPSGSGKTTIARVMFDVIDAPMTWDDRAVVDCFPESLSVRDVTKVCSAVGFNTIPAWLRPFHTLSNGEQFRVTLARRLIESDGMCVVDEFTSVVDRQVARIASHAVQKHARRSSSRFVAVTCHYDVADWLRPDWVIDASEQTFEWRSVQSRPQISVEVARVEYAAWGIFAPFHYMSADLNRSAKCFGLFVAGALCGIAAVLPRPISRGRNRGSYVAGMSRLVTLPDYQGMGFAFVLCERVAAAYRAVGIKYRAYPAHPSLIASFGRSKSWKLIKRPGRFTPGTGKTSGCSGAFGGRPNATFEYVGDALDSVADAKALLQ